MIFFQNSHAIKKVLMILYDIIDILQTYRLGLVNDMFVHAKPIVYEANLICIARKVRI